MATSSPNVPDTKMNGTSGRRSRASASALKPSYEGSDLSERIKSRSARASPASKNACVSTRSTSQAIPSDSRLARTSSASLASSSRCRTSSRTDGTLTLTRYEHLLRDSACPTGSLAGFEHIVSIVRASSDMPTTRENPPLAVIVRQAAAMWHYSTPFLLPSCYQNASLGPLKRVFFLKILKLNR